MKNSPFPCFKECELVVLKNMCLPGVCVWGVPFKVSKALL